MKPNFDRRLVPPETGGMKWDFASSKFGADDLLPLWVAEMDYRVPAPVVEAIQSRAEAGVYGYTFRTEAYLEAIVGWMKKRHHWFIAKEWICHAPGVVPAMHYCVQAYSQPGDKVLIQTPVYPPFRDVVLRNGRQLVCSPLLERDGHYVMDYADLERQLRAGVKLILLCSPHNPVGRVWTPEELQRLGDLAAAFGAIVVADEIHADLVFEPHVHTPYPQVSEAFREHAVVCTSPSKTFNMAGLQAANIVISNRKLRVAYMQMLQQSFVTAPNTFALTATTAAYEQGESWLDECLIYLQGNLQYMRAYMSERLPALSMAEPEGTYLVWIDARRLGWDNGRLHDFLIREAKVAVNFGDTFVAGGDGFFRLNIACPRAVLAEALDRLSTALDAAHA